MVKDRYYLLTNQNHKVMYVGITNGIVRRVYEHKLELVEGFTRKYNITQLVYFEQTNDVLSAISREKEIKNGGVRRKIIW